MTTSDPQLRSADAPAEEAALLARRADFPILEHTNYLINHSLGAMPRQVFDALREYGENIGFRHVASGPLVRSSYHADLQASGDFRPAER